MKILVISRTAWKKSNSFGNTYHNIFGRMDDIQIANIYLADGTPDDDNAYISDYYQVSEYEMIKSVLKIRNAKNRIGRRVKPTGNDTNENNVPAKQVKRWPVFFIARELVWKFGQEDWDGIQKFVAEFEPDIIFLPFYYAMYVDRVALFVKKYFDVPMVLEASIDIYSLKQLSFDPFFWINRFCIRHYIRKTVRQSEKLYVISEKMRKDYEKMLGMECEIVYKFPDRSRHLDDYKPHTKKKKFLFTGNIGTGRWKSLGVLGDALTLSGVGQLDIYTPTPISNEMRKAMTNCQLHAPVTPDEVLALQNAADVLVHAESFELKDKLMVRYSISTKVMDYISAERCIMAIGPNDIASIEFLTSEHLALVANSNEDIYEITKQVGNEPSLISQYAENSHQYMKRTACEKPQYETLREDLERIIDKYKKKKGC